jgi:hypothetical protein
MPEKACEVCGKTFIVRPYRMAKARFCGRACGGKWHAETRLAHVPKPWAIGNQWRKGKPPAHSFPKGHKPWNAGIKGIHLSPDTEFKPGQEARNRMAVGDVTLRNDKHGNPRAWVKVAEPNVWRPRAQIVWERERGAIPAGMIVHHGNRDTTDDSPENLTLVSRAEHLDEHRAEIVAARIHRKSAS